MAKQQRDYALEYERRRIRAQAKGFSSPNELTKYNRAKKQAAAEGKKLTVYNYRQKVQAQTKRNRQAAVKTRRRFKTQTKYEILKMFGVSEPQLNKIRAENRAFSRRARSPRLEYNLKLDGQTTIFTEERVGYILGYNEVFVHPKTKTTTGKRREGYARKYMFLIDRYGLFADQQDLLPYKYARELAA